MGETNIGAQQQREGERGIEMGTLNTGPGRHTHRTANKGERERED